MTQKARHKKWLHIFTKFAVRKADRYPLIEQVLANTFKYDENVGAIIRDWGAYLWYGTIFLFLEQIDRAIPTTYIRADPRRSTHMSWVSARMLSSCVVKWWKLRDSLADFSQRWQGIGTRTLICSCMLWDTEKGEFSFQGRKQDFNSALWMFVWRVCKSVWRKVWRVQEDHLHSAARAPSSPPVFSVANKSWQRFLPSSIFCAEMPQLFSPTPKGY